jgi:methionine synthase I (cobalamin-dependent)
LRRSKFNFKEFLEDEKLKTLVGQDKQYATYVSAIEELERRLKSVNDHRSYQRPDLIQEYHALKIAGVSIGETNAYHLNKVIKNLAVEYQVKSIRFWGKILGYKDYYIIQGVSTK